MQSIVSSEHRLHFFQYFQVDLLQEYLRTGIGYIVNTVLNTNNKLVPLRYWAPEITALIDFIKDLVSLATQKGTYAENFFGFQRPNMGKWSAVRGALYWTILPYISSRLDQYYNQIAGEEIDGKKLSFATKLLKEIYPYLYLLFGLTQTCLKFLYLYSPHDKRHYHLLFKAERLHLSRVQKETPSKYPILQLLKKPGLLTLLIGHKVLNWYFSQKKEKRSSANQKNMTISPPIAEDNVRDSGKCSICTKELTNATMVRSTGYVYCYDCISSFVRKEGKCPMGRTETDLEDLQILYG